MRRRPPQSLRTIGGDCGPPPTPRVANVPGPAVPESDRWGLRGGPGERRQPAGQPAVPESDRRGLRGGPRHPAKAVDDQPAVPESDRMGLRSVVRSGYGDQAGPKSLKSIGGDCGRDHISYTCCRSSPQTLRAIGGDCGREDQGQDTIHSVPAVSENDRWGLRAVDDRPGHESQNFSATVRPSAGEGNTHGRLPLLRNADQAAGISGLAPAAPAVPESDRWGLRAPRRRRFLTSVPTPQSLRAIGGDCGPGPTERLLVLEVTRSP